MLSDVESAGILDKARQNGHPCRHVSANDFKTKLDGPQEQAYIAALREADVDYIVLAGFMRMLYGAEIEREREERDRLLGRDRPPSWSPGELNST